MSLQFCSPAYYLHLRIYQRGFYISGRNVDGVRFNTQLFGGKTEGQFQNLPKSMKHLTK